MRKIVIHNHLPKTRDGGTVRTANEKPATIYEDDNMGWYWQALGGQKSAKLPSKAAAIAAARSAGYPQHIIDAKDGGPGSGPQEGGSSKEKFVEKKNLSPNSKKKEGTTYFAKKPPDTRTMWQKLRYGGRN